MLVGEGQASSGAQLPGQPACRGGRFDEVATAKRQNVDEGTHYPAAPHLPHCGMESEALRWICSLDSGICKRGARRGGGGDASNLSLISFTSQMASLLRAGTAPTPLTPFSKQACELPGGCAGNFSVHCGECPRDLLHPGHPLPAGQVQPYTPARSGQQSEPPPPPSSGHPALCTHTAAPMHAAHRCRFWWEKSLILLHSKMEEEGVLRETTLDGNGCS